MLYCESVEYAAMAELADALDSGSSVRKDVEVQVLLTAVVGAKRELKPRSRLIALARACILQS